MARLTPLDYERVREDAAKRLGVRVTALDRTIETKRATQSQKKLSPHEAETILDEINANNSVVMIGARSRVLRFEDTPHVAGGEHYVHRLPTFVRFDDFRNFYLNRFTYDADGAPISVGKWWLGHPQRRQYRGVVFLPGGDRGRRWPPQPLDRLRRETETGRVGRGCRSTSSKCWRRATAP